MTPPSPISGELLKPFARLLDQCEAEFTVDGMWSNEGQAISHIAYRDARKALRTLLSTIDRDHDQSAEKATAKSGAGWLPIETAPKDRQVLLRIEGGAFQGAWVGPSDGAIYSGRPSAYNWFTDRTHHDSEVEAWAELPATPTVSTSDQDRDWEADERELEGPFETHSPAADETGYRAPLRDKIADFLRERDEAFGWTDADDNERRESAGCILALSSQPERGEIACVACEGKPAPENDPCAVCGLASPAIDQDDEAPFGVTGAASEVEALACVLWAHRCPGIVLTDEDLPYYEAAAKAAFAELDAPAIDRGSSGGVDGEEHRRFKAALQDVAMAEPIPTDREAFDWCVAVAKAALAPTPPEQHQSDEV